MVTWLKQPKTRRRGRHVRKRATRWQHWREVLWPSMGIRAFGRWMLLKLLRVADDPHKVALGFAFGVLVSFTPWVGLHLLAAWGLCWLFGGGYLAAWVATWVGNPWTFPLMWWASLHVGRLVMHVRPGVNERVLEGLTLGHMFENFDRLFWDILLPMSVGGMVVGLVAASASYGPVKWSVRRYHEAKGRRLLERKLAREMAKGAAKSQ